MNISDADRNFIEQCLDAWYDCCLRQAVDVPDDMRVDPLDDEEWTEWKMIPSRLTSDDLEALHAGLPAKLPPLFLAYLSTRHVLDMDFGEYALPALPSDKPLEHAARLLTNRDLWPAGYIQFASGECGDPVCFDFQRPQANGDYPIVVFNHDAIPHEAWSSRETLQPFAREVAGSFRTFLRELCL